MLIRLGFALGGDNAERIVNGQRAWHAMTRRSGLADAAPSMSFPAPCPNALQLLAKILRAFNDAR